MPDTRAFDASKQGYRLIYRPSAVNSCPGCGHSNWFIGRATAECAFCDTALPLQQTGSAGHMDMIELPVAA